jgi:hypothetical protein
MPNLIRGLVILAIVFLPSARSYAQAPNTAAVFVSVTDQANATIPEALISIANDTGTQREAATRTDGTATIAALPIGGTYTVSVTKEGYASEGAQDLVLRAGETATVRVKMAPIGGTSEFTVYGTAHGLRTDPELETRLTGDQIEGIPLLGRKITYLPLMDAAFRPARGTGNLFVNSTFFVTGAGGRRQTDFVVDGATGDEPETAVVGAG